jgi:Flp pilus assembly protein TadG
MNLKAVKTYLLEPLKRWWREEIAVAGVEAAMIFPIMLFLLLGVFDVGNAILANQKTIRASQVVADLVARKNIVSTADVNEAIMAGELAYTPVDSSSYGVDIVSISFDDMANMDIEWRETVNMDQISDVDTRVSALAAAGEGVVMVAVQYEYEPLFAGFVIDAFRMQEVAFSRGRSSPVVYHE